VTPARAVPVRFGWRRRVHPVARGRRGKAGDLDGAVADDFGLKFFGDWLTVKVIKER